MPRIEFCIDCQDPIESHHDCIACCQCKSLVCRDCEQILGDLVFCELCAEDLFLEVDYLKDLPNAEEEACTEDNRTSKEDRQEEGGS